MGNYLALKANSVFGSSIWPSKVKQGHANTMPMDCNLLAAAHCSVRRIRISGHGVGIPYFGVGFPHICKAHSLALYRGASNSNDQIARNNFSNTM